MENCNKPENTVNRKAIRAELAVQWVFLAIFDGKRRLQGSALLCERVTSVFWCCYPVTMKTRGKSEISCESQAWGRCYALGSRRSIGIDEACPYMSDWASCRVKRVENCRTLWLKAVWFRSAEEDVAWWIECCLMFVRVAGTLGETLRLIYERYKAAIGAI